MLEVAQEEAILK